MRGQGFYQNSLRILILAIQNVLFVGIVLVDWIFSGQTIHSVVCKISI